MQFPIAATFKSKWSRPRFDARREAASSPHWIPLCSFSAQRSYCRQPNTTYRRSIITGGTPNTMVCLLAGQIEQDQFAARPCRSHSPSATTAIFAGSERAICDLGHTRLAAEDSALLAISPVGFPGHHRAAHHGREALPCDKIVGRAAAVKRRTGS
jgi:hypothetical protein